MATQGDIAKHLGLDVSSVNKILHHKPGAKFRKATVDQVFRAARKLGFRVEALKHAHRRADPRQKVRISCEITLYREGGEVFDRGTALATELSPHGARLEELRLPKSALPLDLFSVGVLPAGLDAELPGKLVRFHPGPAVSLGIALTPTDPGQKSRLLALVRRSK